MINKTYYKSSTNMCEVADNSVDLIITSPPYFNIKEYATNNKRNNKKIDNLLDDMGAINDYQRFIESLLLVWKECFRVLKPNGKLCINVPLMPMFKKVMNTHYNRHIFDLQSDIQQSILQYTDFYLYDLYIWNRIYQTRDLMFGSYPSPRNLYSQNTSEFITIYVKDGKPSDKIADDIKRQSQLSQKEWLDFTKQIWDIPPPNPSDVAWGKHPAIMPKEIPYRLIRMFSFVGDIVLDCFAGSGTTLMVAKDLKRNYIGYELYKQYKSVIIDKVNSVNRLFEVN